MLAHVSNTTLELVEPIEVTAVRRLDDVEGSLAAIERALASFDDGTYGRCEICATEIEPARLARRASERRCAGHATD